jgi:glutamate-1-semialdehyde 2,1-aminomutase
LAAVTGNDKFRDAAGRIFVTGSFWYGAVAMAAALATLAKLKDIDAVAIMQRRGQQLRDGIAEQARRHGLALQQSGPVQMPVMLFDDDAERRKGWLFCSEALKRGVYLHATHTMFLSAAHSEADIDQALAATDEALAEVARQHGS